MEKASKWIFVSVIVAATFAMGFLVNQHTFANKDDVSVTNAEKLKTLKEKEKNELEKFKAMPAKTQEDLDKQAEQGRKVKEIGLEVGKLQQELDPKDARELFIEDLRSMKGILNENKYYAQMVDHPVHGQSYKKAYEILLQKLQTFEQIEKDFNENKKSVGQLQKELNDLKKIRELE